MYTQFIASGTISKFWKASWDSWYQIPQDMGQYLMEYDPEIEEI